MGPLPWAKFLFLPPERLWVPSCSGALRGGRGLGKGASSSRGARGLPSKCCTLLPVSIRAAGLAGAFSDSTQHPEEANHNW